MAVVKLSSARKPPQSEPTIELFQWPAPPFHHRTPESGALPDGEAEFEFIDGHVETGEIASMGAGDSAVSLRVSGQDDLRRVDLAQVRRVQLKRPLAFVPNDGALTRLGASAVEVSGPKSFKVVYPDDTTFAGTTHGFLRCGQGLYLFLPGDAPARTVSCFIPRAQLKDVTIGALLGETLQQQGQITGPDLAVALDQQERMRTARLGEYLTGAGIVSAGDLTQALEKQGTTPNVKLGEVLVDAKVITSSELERALAEQSRHRERRLGEILVSMGLVSMRTIQLALSEKLGIPFVNAREFPIEPSTLALVRGRFAIAHQLLPLLHMRGALVVAMENPLNGEHDRELGFMTGRSIVPVIANPEDLRERIAREYLSMEIVEEVPKDAKTAREADMVKVEELALQLAKDLPRAVRAAGPRGGEASVNDNTLVKLVNKIIADAHAAGASDIHIESNPGRDSTRIRFRKDGEMATYLELQSTFRHALVSRIKVMAGLDISERRQAQDGKINFGRFGAVPIELRVAIIPTTENLEDVVLRILGGADPIPLDQLGLSTRDLREIKAATARGHGLFLVCGPTGSGKTTTLHSVLRVINRPDMKVWTAEDPIEITQPGLRQVQVNPKIGWTFAAAMRSFLRADPDVIMVGEMRDAETTHIGIEASLTGHLVLSTLHTNSAAESITRLLELGMDPFNFADALVGVLSQRLARRLCPRCKKPHVASEEERLNLAHEYCLDTTLSPEAVLAHWQEEFGRHGQLVLHTAAGCSSCSQGYRGRLGVYELLVATPPVRQLVRSRGTVPQLVAAGLDGGMRLLKQDALRKVLKGELDLVSARAAGS